MDGIIIRGLNLLTSYLLSDKSHTEAQSFTEVFILTQISQKPQKFFCLRSKGYKEKITSKHTKTSKMPLREYYLRLCVRKVI